MLKTFTITKKIAKHGSQSVIVIPSFLNEELKPKTIVEVKINVVKEAENEK
ncbi:hypothetical protein J4214_04870 [Candidatus Woesearchaeota archaeon]|nr:hypothetical protein [Candidatus Woesearchaeota archaeon]